MQNAGKSYRILSMSSEREQQQRALPPEPRGALDDQSSTVEDPEARARRFRAEVATWPEDERTLVATVTEEMASERVAKMLVRKGKGRTAALKNLAADIDTQLKGAGLTDESKRRLIFENIGLQMPSERPAPRQRVSPPVKRSRPQ